MCMFGGAPSMGALPPMPPMPATPPPPPTMVDGSVLEASKDQRRRSSAGAGFAGTIATGGKGVTTPAFTTANFGKTQLGA